MADAVDSKRIKNKIALRPSHVIQKNGSDFKLRDKRSPGRDNDDIHNLKHITDEVRVCLLVIAK